MPTNRKVPLTSALAQALASDDAFRARLTEDPLSALQGSGAEIGSEQSSAEELPATVQLPSKEMCARALGVTPTAATRPATREPSSAAPKGEAAVKRPLLSYFRLRDEHYLDLSALLDGEIEITRARLLEAFEPFERRVHSLGHEALWVISRVPASAWIPLAPLLTRDRIEASLIEDLIERGLLLSNQPGHTPEPLLRWDAAMLDQHWDLNAAFYHFTSRWHDVGRGEDWWRATTETEERFIRHQALHGSAPDLFHRTPNPIRRQKLPRLEHHDEPFATLLARRTSRVFDPRARLRESDLTTLLQLVFGSRGVHEMAPGLTVMRKTSPSGGGLHPIEAYPLVLRADGIASGLYHYNVEHHALDLLEALDLSTAEERVVDLCAGQTYFRTAHCVILLTARFERNFWKYRHHPKAYKVLLMDTGHLSQTFYLVATALGLGAFFTAAINDINLEQSLGLEGFEQGAIAICGCGVPAAGADLSMVTKPVGDP